MIQRLSFPWLLCFFASFAAAAERSSAKVLGVLEDFARFDFGPVGKGRLEHFRWTDAERDVAALHSRVECVPGPDGGRRLHVRIDGELPKSQRTATLLRLNPHFPPDADVVRFHLEVVSGTTHLFIGGPTAYYGNSDVYSESYELRAPKDGGPQKVALDVSVNHPLARNFRRAGFSTEARRIYYTRWAQEPLSLYIAQESQGEFYIDRIELVSIGEGRPFPKFSQEEIKTVRPIADFEDGKLDATFHLYMADGETEWFEQSWLREKPLRFAPVELKVAADEERGAKSLVGVGRYAEEVHCTGIHTSGAPEANALQITLAHEAPEYRNTVVGLGRAEPVDFFVFTAPTDREFPWSQFAPSAELRRGPGPGFDYQLSYRAVRDRQDVDFAIYQTRRYVRPQEWTTLVLPAADLVCVYGSGKFRVRFLADAPLKTLDEAIAVAWLTPWCRAGRGNAPVTTRIDELAFVRVPGGGREHQSFWRIDDWKGAYWSEYESAGRVIRRLHLQGDGSPQLTPGP